VKCTRGKGGDEGGNGGKGGDEDGNGGKGGDKSDNIPRDLDGNVLLHEGKQGKHVPGHNNYQPGKSIFTGDAQELLNNHAGTGNNLRSDPIGTPGTREVVDFGQEIGSYVDRSSGEEIPTRIGIIHYSKTGAHIVPSNPANPPR
jgi:filamentous hemagglutinin